MWQGDTLVLIIFEIVLFKMFSFDCLQNGIRWNLIGKSLLCLGYTVPPKM